nr:leishmanolysin-like peptidase 2 [Biomphalaria glabrata]
MLQPYSKYGYADLYKPIRILPFYSFDEQLLPEEKEALQRVIEKAVRKISKLLSVIRLTSPLLLPRSECPAIFGVGINKGKCARIPKGYNGEICLDNFKIPNAHLQSFIIYNKTSPEPIYVYRDGQGIQNVDYVLYVTSQTTEYCNPYKASAIAYASACQLDGVDRPLAGQVNFCPRTVKAQKFDQEVLYKAALHELFHALGFSNRLYEKFKQCDEENNCKLWPQPILKQSSDGVLRLVTDAVVREMRRHFNCTKQDFGGPIEPLSSSHWDSQFLHSSIMTSKEQKPYQALIDPITLALFEDSGWYKVNYSQADKFIWGKDKGCSFGLKTLCEGQAGFCVGNITGCHHLHLSKARCNSVNSSCGVFAADQKPCFMNSINSSMTEDEIYSPSSRCFLSSLTSLLDETNQVQEKTGRCYETSCEEKMYYVRTNGSDWLPCPPGTYIKVPQFKGELLCPSFEVICSEFSVPEPPVQRLSPSETEASGGGPSPCITSDCFSSMLVSTNVAVNSSGSGMPVSTDGSGMKYMRGLGNWWQVFYVSGAILGARLSASASDTIGTVEGIGQWYSFFGGLVMLYGSRLAGGCTSGHGLSGMGLLALISFVAVPSMFAGGISTAFLMKYGLGVTM